MNPYGMLHTPLKRARLPVPPLPHIDFLSTDDIIAQPSGFVKGIFEVFFDLLLFFSPGFSRRCTACLAFFVGFCYNNLNKNLARTQTARKLVKPWTAEARFSAGPIPTTAPERRSSSSQPCGNASDITPPTARNIAPSSRITASTLPLPPPRSTSPNSRPSRRRSSKRTVFSPCPDGGCPSSRPRPAQAER